MHFVRCFFKNLFAEGILFAVALLLFCIIVPDTLAQASHLAVFLGLVLVPFALWMTVTDEWEEPDADDEDAQHSF